jgi:arylsulfatase A-like enzyme
LRARGYHTALFHSGRFGYLGMAGIIRDRGFNLLADAGPIGGNHESSFGVDEGSAVTHMLSWVDTLPSGAQFALTYMPVAGHHPYVFSGPGAFGASTDIERYRSALHEGDAAIGVLIDGLKSRGLFEKTMFVVYGDHGQAFGQHPGNVGHTFFLYEENLRIPFIVAVPGAIGRGLRSDMTASLVDVTPTALDLLGLGADPGHQGQSAFSGPQRTALFFTDYGASLVGLRDGRWKFIHDLGSGRSRLFDLDVDPRESRDLSAEEPARVSAYAEALRAWSAAQKSLFSPSSR